MNDLEKRIVKLERQVENLQHSSPATRCYTHADEQDYIEPEPHWCEWCGGEGERYYTDPCNPGRNGWQNCPHCDGTGLAAWV